MAVFSGDWAFAFGVLGNIFSFLVFLSPLPTFYNIYKKKSSEGYQSIPCVVALFSAMLWIYYAFLKTNATLLITINTFGCFIETIYVGFFIFYAPKEARIQTIKLLLILVVGGFGGIVLLSHQFIFEGAVRVQVVGSICLVFSLCVFVAPLCIVRQVIKTKSVEYIPFLLSIFLTLSAVMWFIYGLLLKDFNIGIPNVLGFTVGLLQMVLYVMYNKKEEKDFVKEQNLPELKNHVIILHNDKNLPELSEEQIIEIVKLGSLISCTQKFDLALCMHENIAEDHKKQRKTMEI
ncbi:Bidirectional sugar transporter SWEET14 [Capsicum annuum]|uniref:Bidirectional sugar transporter SWEET n=1 Tax=Capsicum annuum TaxID=4072 RepID=A0A2G2ZCZ0_CAPAN|nr:bidirectional sugar transporter SWEET12 [Capsicum annuum]KAF3644094.1 Bidirectional sugar transporter SWEET14 [Capsicum annuum]PHT79866.1 Bidirectional sugar transporter SWEET14 [Capsicum annuum]